MWRLSLIVSIAFDVFCVHPVISPLVAFEFDIGHSAIATISNDSTLSLWNLRDRRPFWSASIRGDDPPSSITFVDNGVVIGRKHGTVFQLLPNKSNTVLSTIKFVHGFADDPDMFGHANYDSRIQTLWVANNRRDSMIAFKLGFETSSPGRGNDARPYIEQVLEFAGPKPTIHFVILTADADPRGEEAHAACVAAKVPPGELALVAFSVHSTGVDQVLVRKEWFDSALATSLAKFPAAPHLLQASAAEPKNQRLQTIQAPPPNVVQSVAEPSIPPLGPRIRTPPSAEEVEAEIRELPLIQPLPLLPPFSALSASHSKLRRPGPEERRVVVQELHARFVEVLVIKQKPRANGIAFQESDFNVTLPSPPGQFNTSILSQISIPVHF
ncbi:hypothetical protein DFH94DRAFT_798661 [Russula ochroleuca]|uniref:Uncharacterized protein n=1 Tax=Russula ochroleuca TaxID=152965 RepID=A0A9P5MUH1_9AGAM|nr:hypothetical protein DFH94DRAFT_798661 [Russula ochroleuca]